MDDAEFYAAAARNGTSQLWYEFRKMDAPYDIDRDFQEEKLLEQMKLDPYRYVDAQRGGYTGTLEEFFTEYRRPKIQRDAKKRFEEWQYMRMLEDQYGW